MTLPGSGPIDLYQIADEFGIAHGSVFPPAFYGLGGAPGSGGLSFADFYGRSSAPPPPTAVFNPDGGSIVDEAPGYVSAELDCSQPAVWTYTGGANGSANIASGTSDTSIIFSVNAPGHTSRRATWNVTGTSGGVSRSFSIDLTADGDLS